MPEEIPITVRGDVDERAVEQLRRCAESGDAVAGVLCADGHVGYSQPIGGAVAYPDHISPSGVGYDIACIAEGELILTAHGLVPIEDVTPDDVPLRPDADGVLSPIDPFVGVVAKGVRDVVSLTLADGRSVRLTPDHEVRTARGWVRADALTSRDRALVVDEARSSDAATLVMRTTCVWVAVVAVEPDGRAMTYDLVTEDPQQAFVAGGITVHNCGNKAVRTNLRTDDVRPDLPRVMDEIFSRVSFGVGRRNDEPVDHPVLDAIGHAEFAPQRTLKDLAARQLGTVGAGNHYVDLFAGDDGFVWVGVHFGSRGFGHKTASGFLSLAAGGKFTDRGPDGEMDSPPVLLHVDSEVGQAYIAAMNLAGEYAYAGRDVVVDRVLEILGTTSTYEVHNHHNFCIAGDQIVPTTAGPKRMDELEVGDEVYAFGEAGPEPTRVAAHWASGEKPIHTIELGSRRLRCSGTHPILIVEGGAVVWRDAQDLSVGDIVVCADAYYPQAIAWGLRRARLVGAFLGDGWIRHDTARQGYSLGLAIGTGDEPHTPRYARLAATVLPNTGWGRGWRIDAPGHFGLSCSSKSAWTTAVKMGLGTTSYFRRVPPGAFALPREEKLALLGGYFDSDGSIAGPTTSNHGRGAICSVSRRLVEDLRELAVSCGLQVTPLSTSHRVTNYGSCTAHRCTIAAGDAALIPLWHADKARNQRATTRNSRGLTAQYLGGARLPDWFFARRVKSIDVGAPEPVFDLTVEHESHSFIVEGVVTHNCWREKHHGVDAWVIRKGCTPAFPGQEGFVGATMGEPSVILRGTDDPAGAALLFSTVHGAGRVMSRTQAAGRMGNRAECTDRDCDFWVSWAQFRHERDRTGVNTLCPHHPDGRMEKRRGRIKSGKIDFDAVQAELVRSGIELRGGAADEAPDAYKRLDAVLAAHGDTVEVLHRLTPIGVAMAPADTFDPYKD